MNTVVLFLLCSLIWGSTWLAITLQLGVVNTLWSICYRHLIAALLLGSFCYLKTNFPRFTFQQHIRMLIQGICLCGISYWLIYESEHYITSGLTALLSTSVLYFNVIIARIWLSNPIRRTMVVGGLLGSVGVVMLMFPEMDFASVTNASSKGMLLVLGGSFILSIGYVACERNEQEALPILPVITLNMLYGGVIVAVIALCSGIKPTFDFSISYIGSLLYLVIFGSIAALTFYVLLIRRIGADRAAFVDIVYPVIALYLSSLVEGYQWSLVAFSGILLIVVGNIVAMKPEASVSGLRQPQNQS